MDVGPKKALFHPHPNPSSVVKTPGVTMAASSRPVFHVIDGGAQKASGRHPSLEGPVVRVLHSFRHHYLFGLAELELAPTSPVASDLVISLPYVGSFDIEASWPARKTCGAYKAYAQIGDLRVPIKEINASRNWLRFQVGHPDDVCVSNLLLEGTIVFLYWVDCAGHEQAVQFQIRREG